MFYIIWFLWILWISFFGFWKDILFLFFVFREVNNNIFQTPLFSMFYNIWFLWILWISFFWFWKYIVFLFFVFREVDKYIPNTPIFDVLHYLISLNSLDFILLILEGHCIFILRFQRSQYIFQIPLFSMFLHYLISLNSLDFGKILLFLFFVFREVNSNIFQIPIFSMFYNIKNLWISFFWFWKDIAIFILRFQRSQ
jgi:hypothetical protein